MWYHDCTCMVPPKSACFGILFGDVAFGRQLGHKDVVFMMGSLLSWEETQESLLIISLSLSFLYEDTARRVPSESPEGGSHQKPNWWLPWSWISQPPTQRCKFLLFKLHSLWYFYYNKQNWQREKVFPLSLSLSRLFLEQFV